MKRRKLNTRDARTIMHEEYLRRERWLEWKRQRKKELRQRDEFIHRLREGGSVFIKECGCINPFYYINKWGFTGRKADLELCQALDQAWRIEKAKELYELQRDWFDYVAARFDALRSAA